MAKNIVPSLITLQKACLTALKENFTAPEVAKLFKVDRCNMHAYMSRRKPIPLGLMSEILDMWVFKLYALNVISMYLVRLTFIDSTGKSVAAMDFCRTIPLCHKYIATFPNVTYWSISPLKVLSPCESFGKDYSLNVRIADNTGKWKLVSNELDFEDIKSEVFDKIDLDIVSEISIRIRHGY